VDGQLFVSGAQEYSHISVECGGSVKNNLALNQDRLGEHMLNACRNKILKTIFACLLLLLTIAPLILAEDSKDLTQAELLRRTQALFDSIVAGDQTPWKRYYADDCLFFDEKGRNLDKTAIVNDITPFPKGYSGSIRILNPKFRIANDVAVLSYDLDESETVFGQQLSARYHETDTWVRRNGNWQIIATQMFRYYEDPSPGTIDSKLLDHYIGTYQLAPDVILTISRQGAELYRTRGKNTPEKLIPEATGIFFRKGVEGRILFHTNQSGKVDQLIDRRNNEDLIWKKVS